MNEKNLQTIAEFGEAQNAISDIVGWHYTFNQGVWGIGFNVPAHATEWHPLVRGGAQAEQEIIALNATMDNQAAEIGRLKAELEAALKDRVAPAVQVEPVIRLNEGGVPEWLPPTWGGRRAPGTLFYATPNALLYMANCPHWQYRLKPESELEAALKDRVALAVQIEPQPSKEILDYEAEHPTAKSMRMKFEAMYGDMSNVMRAMNQWYNTRSEWNKSFNRDREKPVTEADVDEALQKVFFAVRDLATTLQPSMQVEQHSAP